jgi:hypothetical protein
VAKHPEILLELRIPTCIPLLRFLFFVFWLVWIGRAVTGRFLHTLRCPLAYSRAVKQFELGIELRLNGNDEVLHLLDYVSVTSEVRFKNVEQRPSAIEECLEVP